MKKKKVKKSRNLKDSRMKLIIFTGIVIIIIILIILLDFYIKKYNFGPIQDPSLMAYYTFNVDESLSGIITDNSGKGNSGICTPGSSCPVFISNGGADGSGAYSFDGVNDLINLGTNNFGIYTSNEFTISLWAYSSDGAASNEYLISRGQYLHPFWIYFYGSKLRTGVRTSSGANYLYSNTVPSRNQWFHVALTYKNGIRKIYVNGVLDNSNTIPTTLSSQTNDQTMIGTRIGSSDYFKGRIDEVRIYNRELTSTEIGELYNNPSECGNGIIEVGEECETNPLDLQGQTCLSQGFDGGDLGCYPSSSPNKCTYDTSLCYNNPICIDNDLDGYGNPGDASCTNGASTDCNDNNNKIFPNAPEICDGLDNQCPGNSGYGQIDEGGVCTVDPNLVLHLKFENNFDDSSSYNNDADCPDPVNCPPSTIGGDGSGASDYRGVVSALTVPKSASLDFGTGSFSTSSWIKIRTADNSAGERIINNRGQGGLSYTGWQLKIKQGTGGWGFYDTLIVESNDYLGCTAFCGTGVYSYNNWHHVVTTFDNSVDVFKIYVDGVLKYTDTSVANAGGGNGAIGNINNNLDNIIGASFYNAGVKLSSPQQLLDGIVDEVRIYNKILTSTEVTTLYNQYDLPTCGNSQVEGDEACDDGDTQSGDGCSSSCQIESGWTCVGEPSVCTPIQTAVCGNGDIQTGETCDDGDTQSGDGCSSSCQIESGWTCVGEPSVCSIITGNAPYVGHSEVDNLQLYNDWVTNNPGCMNLLKSKKIIIGGRSWMQNVVSGLKREGYDMSAASYPTGDQHRPYNGNVIGGDMPENIFSLRKHVLYMSIVNPLNSRPIEFRSFFNSGESFTYPNSYTTNHDFSDDGLAMAMLESRADILASPQDPLSMYNQYTSINSQLQANNPSIKFVYTTQMAYGYYKDDNEAAEIYNKDYMLPNQKGNVPLYDYHDITIHQPNSNTKCYAGGFEAMCLQYSADGGTHPSSVTGETRLGKGLLLLMAQMYCDNPYT